MAKGKSKTDFKQLLLKKGEYIAMGVAGLLLVIFLGWGISHWAGKDDPDKIAKELSARAQGVTAKINSTELSEEDKRLGDLPEWIKKDNKFDHVSVRDFPLTTPPFDVTGKPDTKRENPSVLTLGNYQVDLIRVPMRGYDIVYAKGDEEPLIAMIASRTVSEQDKDKGRTVGKLIRDKGRKGQESFNKVGNQPPGGGGQPPAPGGGGMPPGGGSQGPAPGGGSQGPPPGGFGGPPGGFGGMMGGGYDGTAKRDEANKVIKYIPLDQYDDAVEKQGMLPAMTVIPLRMVTIHAEVNLKQQLEEIKRALRLPNTDEARKWGPIFDGYEVQRRVTRILPDGTVDEIQPWAEYKFEDKYAELINSRKLADQIEDGYLAHFIRYDMNLALPLPQLVEELGSYAKITLPSITKTISDMEKAKKPKVSPSTLQERLKNSKNDLYKPQSGDAANKLFGDGTAQGFPGTGKQPMGGGTLPPMGGGTVPPGGAGSFKPGDAGTAANAPPVDIDHLLLRFVDADVKPGHTYEYRIRLRMLNPNFGREKDVSNPAHANIKELYSRWTQLQQSVTIPTESHLFATDPANYRKKIEEEYKDQKELQDRLLWKPNQNMAVVEMLTWMEDVKIDAAGTRREPVGAWVVADIPVGRGEYVGRKTYLKLPLWSSETNQYVLREVQDKILAKVGGKDVPQPKGWLVDFSTKSVLVDFEGGKVNTKPATGRAFAEEVATEMLIALPNGRLMVKKSVQDEADKNRINFVAAWEKWVKAAETRKAGGGEGSNPFDKKDKPNN